jgi:hypothetical protein
VRDQNDGAALLAGGVDQQVHHPLAGERVERSRGLVGEHDVGARDQRPRHRHPLALTARQLARAAALEPPEPEALEPRGRLAESPGPRPPGQQQRQGHVLDRRQLGDELAELEHEPEAPPAQLGAGAVAHPVDAVPVEPDLARVGRQDAGQAVQQGRLPRAARAHEGDDLAGGDLDVGAPQGLGGPERAGHPAGGEEGAAAGGRLAHAVTSALSWSSRDSVRSIHRRSASRWKSA